METTLRYADAKISPYFMAIAKALNGTKDISGIYMMALMRYNIPLYWSVNQPTQKCSAIIGAR
jgi:hypothetical protein